MRVLVGVVAGVVVGVVGLCALMVFVLGEPVFTVIVRVSRADGGAVPARLALRCPDGEPRVQFEPSDAGYSGGEVGCLSRACVLEATTLDGERGSASIDGGCTLETNYWKCPAKSCAQANLELVVSAP